MDLLNSDNTSSNNFSTLDSFYSLETLPPLNFLADATLLIEGQQSLAARSVASSGGRQEESTSQQHVDLIHSSTVAWSNHESFDLLINAAISEGFYDQSSRLSPPTLPDGLFCPPNAEMPVGYANLVDMSQSQSIDSSTFAESLQAAADFDKPDNGLVFCRVENNALIIDLRQLFTTTLTNLAKTLINPHKPSSRTFEKSSPPTVPVVIKFPMSDVNVRLRVDQLCPDISSTFSLATAEPESNSEAVEVESILLEHNTPIVGDVNEVRNPSGVGKSTWKCHLCTQKVYATRSSLQVHFLKHANKKPFACCRCKKTFAQVAHFNSHFLRCHKPKTLHCPAACGQAFNQRKTLIAHMINSCKATSESDLFAVRCEQCPTLKVDSIRELGQHLLANMGHFFASSSTSNGSVGKEIVESFVDGKQTSTVVATFVCNDCDATFGNARRLNEHKNTVHRKIHVCRLCAKRFGKKSRLALHEAKCAADKGECPLAE